MARVGVGALMYVATGGAGASLVTEMGITGMAWVCAQASLHGGLVCVGTEGTMALVTNGLDPVGASEDFFSGKTLVDVAIDGKSLGKALVDNLATSAVRSVSAYGAKEIGDMMNVSRIGSAGLHGLLGAGMGAGLGAIRGQDIGKSMASGVAGSIAESLPVALEMLCTDHLRGLSGKELDYARDIIAQVGKMGAVLASKGLDLNTEIALETADNAVTNNFMEHFAPGTGIPGMAFLDKAEDRTESRLA